MKQCRFYFFDVFLQGNTVPLQVNSSKEWNLFTDTMYTLNINTMSTLKKGSIFEKKWLILKKWMTFRAKLNDIVYNI